MLVTKQNFDRVMRALGKPKRVIADTETTGLLRQKGDVVCGVAVRLPDLTTPAYYFPCRHDGGNLPASAYHHLLEWLAAPALVRTGWNWKFDLKMLNVDGFPIPEYDEDVMLAAHLANENERSYRLKEWADRYIDPNSSKAEQRLKDLLASRGLSKGDIHKLHAAEAEEYACIDVDLTEKARRKIKRSLRGWGLWWLWREVNEYMIATTYMELRGIMLDVPLMKEYIKEADLERGKSLAVLEELAGYKINPRSHPQMQALLGLPSSAMEFIEPLQGKNAVVDAVINFRRWDKVNGTYYNKYLEKMDDDHILYPNIKLHGTIAGRPSSEDPNLQAIPRKSTIYKVKNVLRARKGFTYLSVDYSQAELRYAAHETNDPALQAAFASGMDIHQATADRTGLDRDTAKRINFGVVYGLAAPGLSKKLKVKQAQAQVFLDQYHGLYRRIRPTYKRLQRQAKSRGYIRLWTGRVRRYFTQIYPEPHKALSNKIQGGVAEIMRHAICKLSKEMYREGGRLRGCHMLLQVHDQILFEVPNAMVDRTVPIIEQIMTDFPQFKVRPKVDTSVGPTLGGVTKYIPPEIKHAGTRNGSRGSTVRVRREGRDRQPHAS